MQASVIIPTYNRRASVVAAVERLLQQDFPSDSYEVIVSCKADGTAELLKTAYREKILILESSSPGPAAARNLGLRHARGEVVIFLDDDMEPEAGFVSNHVRALEAEPSPNVVVIGYSPPLVDENSTPLQRQTARDYQELFRDLEQSVPSRTPIRLTAGNFSMRTEAMRRMGGFNESYVFARDDFELAARLEENGFTFRFCKAARANMHISTTADELMQRALERARNDLRLAQDFPWRVLYLPFYRSLGSVWGRLRWRLLWAGSPLASPLLGAMRSWAPENLFLVRLEYAARYCLALREEIGSWPAFRRLRSAASQEVTVR